MLRRRIPLGLGIFRADLTTMNETVVIAWVDIGIHCGEIKYTQKSESQDPHGNWFWGENSPNRSFRAVRGYFEYSQSLTLYHEKVLTASISCKMQA
jgi:hypothetical protein